MGASSDIADAHPDVDMQAAMFMQEDLGLFEGSQLGEAAEEVRVAGVAVEHDGNLGLRCVHGAVWCVALVRAVAAGIFVQSVFHDVKLKLDISAFTNLKAVKGMALRNGLGLASGQVKVDYINMYEKVVYLMTK